MGTWQSSPEAFEIDDYFRMQRITELSLSSDGGLLAYATERIDCIKNRAARTVYIDTVGGHHQSNKVGELFDARALAWIPGSHVLAFLSDRAQTTQVFSYDLETGRVRQETSGQEPVVQFQFSPDGERIAYTTRAVDNAKASLFWRLQSGASGVLIEPDSVGLYAFVNPHYDDGNADRNATLWVASRAATPVSVRLPGDVRDFFWSSDGEYLSVVYIDATIPRTALRPARTSVGVVEAVGARFRALANASVPTDEKSGRRFAGGQWVPNKKSIVLTRVIETHPWYSALFPEWTIVEVENVERQPWHEERQRWHEAEMYGNVRVFPVNTTTILVENTVKSLRSLYQWTTTDDVRKSRVMSKLDGSSKLFTFSADFRRVAFVNESMIRPPEIYVRDIEKGSKQHSNLNARIARNVQWSARVVNWKSADGTRISGWILEPSAHSTTRPWAMITFIHGGPGFPFPNAFAPYFAIWPYPFEVYAAHGIAVFFPNYRGTATFGRKTAIPSALDAEPISDVLSGIEHLIDAGIADPDRLGISGQSWGAWLGPMILVREKTKFRVASFAEGSGNRLVIHNLQRGDIEREIGEKIWGGTPYDDPWRFIELSPDLHFRGISAATLFESGAWSNAVQMLGYAKSARRFEVPSESVVYPRTAHNLKLPRLQREAAERNLDWFLFWLNEKEDPDPQKIEQYQRWRKLKVRCRVADTCVQRPQVLQSGIADEHHAAS